MTSFAAALARSNGGKLRWRDTIVHSFVTIPVVDGTQLNITRVNSSKSRAQALKLAVDRGDLRVNGLVVQSAAIWSHTAPVEVRVQIAGRRARHIDLWNGWSFQGTDSSWIGNAALIMESKGATSHILRCSDGVGPPRFDDLIVKLELTHP